jgi:hypothetical protein
MDHDATRVARRATDEAAEIVARRMPHGRPKTQVLARLAMLLTVLGAGPTRPVHEVLELCRRCGRPFVFDERDVTGAQGETSRCRDGVGPAGRLDGAATEPRRRHVAHGGVMAAAQHGDDVAACLDEARRIIAQHLPDSRSKDGSCTPW